ncbi:MAG: glycosyl hydrolase [Aeromicrobium sp.]
MAGGVANAAAPGPGADLSPRLTAASFAEPPTSTRPMYRYWMPLAFTDDDVIRSQIQQLSEAGAGGIEVVPFYVPGEGRQSNAFLAEYGWGTPEWAHKMEIVTEQAAKFDLIVDQNLGPQYPPTVPTLNSFNQPEAEQQLIFGREFNAAGASRTGALPAPTTAPPTVTTKLCRDAAVGDTTVGVSVLGGLAAGDVITIGAGADVEKVEVTKLGDRLATCGDLSVKPLTTAHATAAVVTNVARSTRLHTLVAQCSAECGTSTSGPITLDPASVVDVTGKVTSDGQLSHTFPQGNGHPWVVIDFQQTASGLIAQRGGYTATQPNYVVDHWSAGGATIQADFWDENILTPAVSANLEKIGGGAIFEDSLELGETQKWTHDLLEEFEDLRGYDLATRLPAIAGAGIQGTHAPAFELEGIGPKVREDYRQTMSDLYSTKYVRSMQAWTKSHGLEFRAQSYGTPISSAEAAAEAGIPEGESLNFGSPNPLGAEQDYRVVSAGAHASGRNIVSVECCAVFQGAYRSTVSGPAVAGQYGTGGDGTNLAGRYGQGLVDSINKSYAGGVNQLVWHGFPYRDAPAGVGTTGRDGQWPGYNPWDIFGALNASENFGPRLPSWPDYAALNDSLGRTQLALRQGRATLDLAVYYEDLGLIGSSAGIQQSTQHMLGTDSATSKAGYTYGYVAPGLLNAPGLTPDADGGIFESKADYDALILNDQTTMPSANAKRLLELAKQGLRIFVVGETPSSTTGVEADQAELASTIAELLKQPSVVRVAGDAALPAALVAAGIRPAVAPSEGDLGLVRREAGDATYDFVYNRSSKRADVTLDITGTGTPYLLDTWSGDITPLSSYSRTATGVSTKVSIGAHDSAIVMMARSTDGLPTATKNPARPGDFATVARGTDVALRVTENGATDTTLSDGQIVTTDVKELAGPQGLGAWKLKAQTWTKGATQWTSKKTNQDEIALTAGENGRLPSWLEIAGPVDLTKQSGVGTYTSTFTLPDTWVATDGAYLDLGDVVDTVRVTINGKSVLVNQADKGRIDLGAQLTAGANRLEVRVATTMFNAVKASGDSNYSMPPAQRTGLIGPITVSPYRDVTLVGKVTPPTQPGTPAKKVTRTSFKLNTTTFRKGTRPTARIAVTSGIRVHGVVEIRVDGRQRNVVKLVNGKATVKLTSKLGRGRHKVQAVFRANGTFAGSKSVTRNIRVK